MNKDDINKAIFEQAAKDSLANPIPVKEEKPVKSKEEMLAELQDVVEEASDANWNRLARKMDGEFADRMIKEMGDPNMSGANFIKNYLKLLEYFRPKITRVEKEEKEDEDRVLRIEVVNSQNDLIDNTIDIKHEEHED